jgi:hypothetical protein
MAVEFMLINLDSGDVLFLGDQRSFRPIPEIGIGREHRFFDEIPNYDSAEPTERLRDFYRKSGHALNFFLAHSRGCRLIVMEAQEIFALLGELGEEFPGVVISLAGSDGSRAKFYENRLRTTESVRPITEAEEKTYADRALHYKNEIKEIFRKNIEKNKIDNPGALEVALGNLPPNPVFTPWDG